MKRYNLANLPENCRIVPDCYGDWMRVAEHEVLTVKYRDALEQIVEVGNSDSNFPQDGRMYDIAKAALES